MKSNIRPNVTYLSVIFKDVSTSSERRPSIVLFSERGPSDHKKYMKLYYFKYRVSLVEPRSKKLRRIKKACSKDTRRHILYLRSAKVL